MTATRVARPATPADATYRKSTRSSAAGNCLEVAALPGGCRAVRDSKHPTGPALTVTAADWSAFTTGLRTGDVD